MTNQNRPQCLILQTAFLGDVLLSIPLLKRLNALGYKTTYICREGLQDFLLSTGLVDACHPIIKNSGASYASVLSKLGNFDLLLCPHQSFRSAWAMKSVKAKTKISFDGFIFRFVSDIRVFRNARLPDALRQLSLLGPIDAPTKALVERADRKAFENTKLSDEGMALLRESSMEQAVGAASFLEVGKKYVCLAPGSRWLTKRWTVSGFKEVARSFLECGYKIVCVGSADEYPICQEVIEGCPDALNLAGKLSLIELHGVLSKSSLLICNDSGAMHMASVAGVACVSVFGPTTPGLGYRPWNPRSSIVQNENLSCRPCGKHGHMKCPIGTHECMRGIDGAEVIRASRQFLPDLLAP